MRALATIYRDLRDLFDELAERAVDAERTLDKAKAGPKKARTTTTIARPAGESNDLDRARARRILHRVGCTETDR